MAITFKWRRGTAASWSSTNPTLNAGEPGLETDTGKFKIGDGTTVWTSLGYATAVGNVTGLGANVSTFLATPSSANLASAVTDETGTGALVFANTPTLVSPVLGTPTSGTLTNCTGLPVSGITASTTTALGVGSIELGNANDTTISRVSAGVAAIEGVNIVTTSSTDTLTNKTLTTPVITMGTSTPSFTSNAYTLVSGDAGKFLLASNSSTAGTINVPTNATTAFAVGTQITIIQTGSGQLTVSATTPGTTTILSSAATAASPKCRVQYSAMTLIKTATDTWYAVGDIA